MRCSRPVAFRVVDPGLKGRAGPGGGPAAQMDRRWEAALVNAAVNRRSAECCNAHHIAQPIKGGWHLGCVWLGQGLVEEHGGSLSNDAERMRPALPQINLSGRATARWVQECGVTPKYKADQSTGSKRSSANSQKFRTACCRAGVTASSRACAT